MANFVFNIAKGRVGEFYNRVKGNDPANSAFILVPLEFTGIVSDATLLDYDDLNALLAGATNEQTTMGRITITDADLAAFPAPDDTNDRFDFALPTKTWSLATGSRIAKVAVCYDSDTTGGTDANIIPCTCFDFDQTPNGTDITLTGSTFYRAG